MFVVIFKCVSVLSVRSIILSPSTVSMNDVAFAVGVPDVVSDQETVLVVAPVDTILAGANLLALMSTGNSVFNPILL